jgi:hypothetical protein
MRRRRRSLYALAASTLATIGLVLGPIAPALAYVESVTASVTPGVTVLSTDTLTTGATIRTTTKLPDGYAPIEFAAGTSAQQLSVKYAASISLTAATPQTLDLENLTGGTGAATFTKLKVFAIYNTDTTDSLIVGAAAANPFLGPLAGTAPTYTIKAGCAWICYDRSTAGMTVNATNSDLKLDPGANAVTCVVVFAGN